jgi:hypothetical protein
MGEKRVSSNALCNKSATKALKKCEYPVSGGLPSESIAFQSALQFLRGESANTAA